MLALGLYSAPAARVTLSCLSDSKATIEKGAWRFWFFLADVCGALLLSFRPVLGEVLFFVSPKKSTQKKGDPKPPPLFEGYPALLGTIGARLTRSSHGPEPTALARPHSSNRRRAFSRLPLRCSAVATGVWAQDFIAIFMLQWILSAFVFQFF